MRKLFLTAIVGTLACLLLNAECSACGRRHGRWRRSCCPAPCMVYVSCVAPPFVAQGGAPAPATGRVVKSPRTGRLYAIRQTSDRGNFEHDLPPVSLLEKPAAKNADTFLGTARKAAKLSIADGPPTPFATIAALMDTLPSDAAMRTEHQPPIIRGPTSKRVQEEQQNVAVDALLYAAKKEADNDFHLLLGDDPAVANGRFFTAEVSGLPTAGPFRAPLQQVRQAFKDFFGAETPRDVRYVVFQPPIPVRVTGSLFFDTDHKPGDIGTGQIVPQTTWEIHPVTQIVFEP